MEKKSIAKILYALSLDMDYADYTEHMETDIESIEEELNVLEENNCSCLLNALEMIAMNNEDMESFYNNKVVNDYEQW